MRLNFHVQGDGSPLIILHGLLGSLDNWRAMNKRLAEHHRVYSVDLRNHGASPHDETMNHRVMAEDVAEFCAEHKIQSTALLGHSMGGKVAMRCAADFPALIRKLIVVDIAPRSYPPTHTAMLQAMRALPVESFSSFAEIDAALAPAIPDSATRQFLLKNLTRAEPGFRWRVNLDAILRNYRALTEAIELPNLIAQPTLFIRAGKQSLIEERDIAVIGESFANAEFVTIESAGHWVHIDAADRFDQVVSDFLART